MKPLPTIAAASAAVLTEHESKTWIQTGNGVSTDHAFWPAAPKAEHMHLEEGANALSNLCRFTGHVRTFYSVAEHCVRVLDEVRKATRNIEIHKMALLHDYTEGFCNDLARPIKRDPLLHGYVVMEAGVEAAVVERFNLAGRPSENALITTADLRMCNAERLALKGPPPFPWGSLPDASSVSTFGIGWAPKRARREFLAACKYLGIS